MGNVSTNATEMEIADEFCRFGAVGSIKVMYPRSTGDGGGSSRRSMSAFVAFMKRDDAERALEEMNGRRMRGNELRCNWGKPVTLPGEAAYVMAHDEDGRPCAVRNTRTIADTVATSGLPFNAQMPLAGSASASASASSSVSRTESVQSEFEMSSKRQDTVGSQSDLPRQDSAISSTSATSHSGSFEDPLVASEEDLSRLVQNEEEFGEPTTFVSGYQMQALDPLVEEEEDPIATAHLRHEQLKKKQHWDATDDETDFEDVRSSTAAIAASVQAIRSNSNLSLTGPPTAPSALYDRRASDVDMWSTDDEGQQSGAYHPAAEEESDATPLDMTGGGGAQSTDEQSDHHTQRHGMLRFTKPAKSSGDRRSMDFQSEDESGAENL